MPDPTIRNISLAGYCYINVDVANIGPGDFTDADWSQALVQGYLDGSSQQFFSTYLYRADPEGMIKHANGSRRLLIPVHLPAGTHQLRVRYHNSMDQDELNPGNNEMVRTLTCSTPLPDLTVTSLGVKTRLDDGRCIVKATIKNMGGPIPELEFDRALISWGESPGVRTYLKIITGAGALKNAGGSVTFNPLGVGGILQPNEMKEITVWVDEPSFQEPSFSSIVESNESKNKLVRRVRCLPDLPATQAPGGIGRPKVPSIPLVPVLANDQSNSQFRGGEQIVFISRLRPVVERQNRGRWEKVSGVLVTPAGGKGKWRVVLRETGRYRLNAAGRISKPFTVKGMMPLKTNLAGRSAKGISGQGSVPAIQGSKKTHPANRIPNRSATAPAVGAAATRIPAGTVGKPLAPVISGPANKTLVAPATVSVRVQARGCGTRRIMFQLFQGKRQVATSSTGRFNRLGPGSYRVRAGCGNLTSSWLDFRVIQAPPVNKAPVRMTKPARVPAR